MFNIQKMFLLKEIIGDIDILYQLKPNL